MSHVKNMQSFAKLTSICIGLERNYYPGKQNLQVNAITDLSTIVQQIGEGMRDARKNYDSNVREEGFGTIRHSARMSN